MARHERQLRFRQFAVYDVKGDDTKIIRMLVPVGLMLRPGFRFSIDKGPLMEGGAAANYREEYHPFLLLASLAAALELLLSSTLLRVFP